VGHCIIQVDKFKDPLQQGGHPDTVSPNNPRIKGIPGEKGIGYDDFVPVAHTEQGVQQFRAYNRIYTNEHTIASSNNEEP
jgi:hypothetical protein